MKSVSLIHIGENVGVKSSEIIGIFDLENATKTQGSRRFLVKAEKDNVVTYLSEKMPRTFVVTDSREGRRVFLTQISSKALLNRTENNKQES